MNNRSPCPNCGRPLPATAPQGLCPECLLQGAFPTGTEPNAAHKIRFIPPKPEELGTRFPQLEILAFIGQGGMGAVYKARQKQLDRIVALKILPPEIALGENFAARFEREAKALAKLNHPGIVILYEFGQSDGLYYFLMEYVDGLSLRQLLHTGRIAPAEALAIVPQICDALQFAHDRGIVHRDIKPENILLSKEGRVKIADFGLAKITGDRNAEFRFGANPDTTTPNRNSALQALTDANKIMGTPNYMAPEQTTRPADVDHRADIYALGVVFYQMLTGELPGKKLATPSTRVQIDVRLDEVVLRALQAEPARRYQTVTALKTELDAIKNPPDDPQLAQWEKRAPGWRIRCRKCGFTEHWGKYGIRLAAIGNKWIFGRCPGCRRFGWQIVENIATFASPNLGSTREDADAEKSKTITPSFSRPALIGFIWASIALLSLVLYFVTGVAPIENLPPGYFLRELWRFCVHSNRYLITPIGWSAFAGTTFLGWLAVTRIRRSSGMIHGLGLATFDGLIFPLLTMDYFLLMIIKAAFHPHFKGPILITVIAAIGFLDFWIIRKVWRTVNQPDPGFSPVKSQPDARPTTLLACAVLTPLIIGLILLRLLGSAHPETPDYLPGNKRHAPSRAIEIEKPAAKTILLTRVTNNFVGKSQDTQALTVWSDTALSPGESLSAYVKHDEGEVLDLGSSEFINWQPRQTGTSSYFRWWFGGHFEKDFGPTEADAAAAQIRALISDHAISLASGQTISLFAVTNSTGKILRGYLGYQLTLPLKSTNAKIQAVVRFDHSNWHRPPMLGLQYDATVPPGYSLWATANRGNASTTINHGPTRPYMADYSSSWMDSFHFSPVISGRPGSVIAPPPASMLSNANGASSFPQRPSRTPPSYPPQNIPGPQIPAPPHPGVHRFQDHSSRGELEKQLESVENLDSLTITLGQPYLVFSITNAPDDIYQGYLELHGPTDH